MFGFRSDKSKAKSVTKNESAISSDRSSDSSVSVGYIGKLPSHADFLSHNAVSREVQELDDCLKQWVMESDQAINRQGVDQDKPLNSVGFVLVGGHGRQTLLGSIYDSSDRLGRRYPFTYFVRINLTDLYFRPALAWFAGEKLLADKMPLESCVGEEGLNNEDCTGLMSGLPRTLPTDKVLEQLRISQSDFDSLTVKELKSATMSSMVSITYRDWVEEIIGGDAGKQAEKLARLRQSIEHYLDKGARAELTLPLGSSRVAKLSVLFWTHLLSLFLAGKEWRPDMIWSMNESACFLYVLDRPLTPSRLNKAFFNEQSGITEPVAQSEYVSWANKMLADESLLLLDAVIAWGHSR